MTTPEQEAAHREILAEEMERLGLRSAASNLRANKWLHPSWERSARGALAAMSRVAAERDGVIEECAKAVKQLGDNAAVAFNNRHDQSHSWSVATGVAINFYNQAAAAIRALKSHPASPAPSVEEIKDTWLIWFEESGKEPLLFSGDGAEEAAHRTFKMLLTDWACHLFRTIPLSPSSTLATAPSQERGELAALIHTYYMHQIGVMMHQAEHWAANGKPSAVNHRLHKADNYFQVAVLFDPARRSSGWDDPFKQMRDELARPEINPPGKYPPSRELFRYSDARFVAQELDRLAGNSSPDLAALKRLEEAAHPSDIRLHAIALMIQRSGDRPDIVAKMIWDFIFDTDLRNADVSALAALDEGRKK